MVILQWGFMCLRVLNLRIVWLFATTAPIAFLFATVSDLRIFWLWLVMWQFNLWPSRWWRHVAVLLAMVVVAVVTHWILEAPSAIFFMGLVLLFGASEYHDRIGCPYPFGLIGVIFPALSILALQQNILMFLAVFIFVLSFVLVFVSHYNDMLPSAMRFHVVPVMMSIFVTFMIAVLGFVILPRIGLGSASGFAPAFNSVVRSGVPEDLNLTNFGDLFDSSEIMFRAYMDEPLAADIVPYWRVYVLDRSDSARWYRSHVQRRAPPHIVRGADASFIRVKIWHPNAPSHEALPLLGVPMASSLSGQTQLTFSGTNEIITRGARASLPRTLTFGVSLADHFTADMLSIRDVSGVPRLRDWAQKLRAESQSDKVFVARLMRYFALENYQYTLTPPRLNSSSMLDDFFFRTRTGYCSHYALALASALRAGGIAANVITGYAGGDWNRYGRYYLIRASDAHAWVEAELRPGVWTRLDATRVLRARADTRMIAETVRPQSYFALSLIQMRERLDALLTQFNNEIVLYDRVAQRDLFLTIWVRMKPLLVTGVLFLILGSAILGFVWMMIIRSRLEYIGVQFERLAKCYGITHTPTQGWLAFARIFAAHVPTHADAIYDFAHCYTQLVFGRHPARACDHKKLRQQLRHLRAQIRDQKQAPNGCVRKHDDNAIVRQAYE